MTKLQKLLRINTTNVKNMHLHRDSNPGPWNTVPMQGQMFRIIQELSKGKTSMPLPEYTNCKELSDQFCDFFTDKIKISENKQRKYQHLDLNGHMYILTAL